MDYEEVEYIIKESADGNVKGVYVHAERNLTQTEFLNALQYFIDKVVEQDEDLFGSPDLTHYN